MLKSTNKKPKSKYRIALIVPTLGAGGAERIMSFIAQHIDKDRFKATLVVVGNKTDAVYKVKDIDVIFFNKPRVRHAFPHLFKLLLTHKFHLVFSTMGHVNVIMALYSVFFPKRRFVGRETMIRSTSFLYKPPKKGYLHIDKPQKVFLDAIICQSLDMKKDLVEYYKFPPKKLIVINNPITSQFTLKDDCKTANRIQLITIGRLTKIKGQLRIIQLLGKLDIPFAYTLIGSGPELAKIRTTAIDLGISDHIEYIAYTENVEHYLQKSDIYLQGSYSEGFPNALLESCAVGTPVIAYFAPGGTQEIIVPGVNGYIARTEDEYLDYIRKIHREQPMDPCTIRNSVMERFSASKIIGQYEQLFVKLIDGTQ